MSGQREQDPDIQAFRGWEKNCHELGTGREGGTFKEAVPYFPIRAIRQHMIRDKGAKNLLKTLYRNTPDEAPTVDSVLTRYIKVFAILVSVGYGDWIHLFEQQGLEDSKLPFTSEPQHFPGSENDILWNLFSSSQWKFSPCVLHAGGLDRKLSVRDILPLRFKRPL